MQRAYWSADFAEAHLVVAMLRANDVDAHVFDRNMVRQDWFQTLAFGGYRVMVADAGVERAKSVLEDYRAGRLALDDATTDRPACPRCGSPGGEDSGPRRLIFALMLVGDLVAVAIAMLVGDVTERAVPVAVGIYIVGVLLIPIALSRFLRNRYRCIACGLRWRARPTPYAEAAREVDVASHAASDA
jgi:hypothetical protein